jgi:ATP-dependent RNA circularization protein (DNA/RNA ligase family)
VRKYQGLFNLGEEVVLTEKIHGCNARFGWYKRKFYVGSRTQYRSEGDASYWSEVARDLGLKDKLKPYPGIALYGEVFGSGVQDLEYGAPAGKRYLRVFDVLDIETRKWWDYDRAKEFVEGTLGLKMAPELYRGPWQGLEAHAPLGEGRPRSAGTPLTVPRCAASVRAGS